MAIKWDKINWDLIGRLKNLAKSSFNNGDYVGAFVLRMLFLEAALSFAIWTLLSRKIGYQNIVDKYIEGYPTFSSLIDYFFLLSFDEDIYAKLRTLNKDRNKIVHNIFELSSFDLVLQESRKLYLEAEYLEKALQEKYFPSKPSKEETKYG